MVKIDQNKSTDRFHDTLRLAVFLNKKDIAAVIWHTCEHPLSKLVMLPYFQLRSVVCLFFSSVIGESFVKETLILQKKLFHCLYL